MNTYADNNKENKKQQTPSSIQKKNNGTVVSLVSDSHPSSVAAQMQLQKIADNSPQVKQALQLQAVANTHATVPIQKKELITTTQSVFQLQKLEAGKLNVVGEHHSESSQRREQEIDLAAREVGGEYWTENNFRIRETKSKENAVKDTAKDPRILGDALYLRIAESIQYAYDAKNDLEKEWNQWTGQKLSEEEFPILKSELQLLLVACKTHTLEANRLAEAYMYNEEYKTLPKFVTDQIIQIHKLLPKTKELFLILAETWKNHTLEQLISNKFLSSFNVFGSNLDVLNIYATVIGGASRTDTSKLRSYEMDNAADFAHDRIGVWKIGFDHVKDIKDEMQHNDTKNYVLINREEFNHEYKELPILVEGHMVQRKQESAKPTMQMKGKVNVNVNDDAGLEKEADVMGAKALQTKPKENKPDARAHSLLQKKSSSTSVIYFEDNRPQMTEQQKTSEALNLSTNKPIQMMPNWANYLLGTGGIVAAGAAAIGTAPIWAGLGGIAALGTATKGLYDNRQEQARIKKTKEKRNLDIQYNTLHKREERLLAELREMPAIQIKRRPQVEQELDQINIERRSLIDRTIKGGHELWLPPSVHGQDRDTARDLFSSISKNQGNIKIAQNDQEFRLSALSDISKLVQSNHARTMLGRLNSTQPGGNIRNIDIAPTTGETDNAPKGSINDGHTGEGSKVSINYDEPSINSMGTNGGPIYDPTYIKLGHELGHASHYLTDTASANGDVQSANGDAIINELWTNEEEYNNITGEENPIRKDLGLTTRVYHKSYSEVPRIRIIRPILAKINIRMKKISKRMRELNITQEIDQNHTDVRDDAESWMHPDTRWLKYSTKELASAGKEAENAVSLLESVVEKIEKRTKVVIK
jgi:chemotaxis regulatin CheY-phosphate phosphatase CheZ